MHCSEGSLDVPSVVGCIMSSGSHHIYKRQLTSLWVDHHDARFAGKFHGPGPVVNGSAK